MGGPAGSGGSDKSDERKVDTYADQLKKIQKEKNRKKSLLNLSPVYNVVKNVADKHNLNRRMKYANKQGINIQGLSTSEILSKDFKAQLDAKGYSEQPGNVGNKDDNRTTKSIEQPKVKAQLSNTEVKSDNIVADKIAPTTVEMGDNLVAELTQDQKKLKINRGKKPRTLLTDEYEKPTLSQKALLA